MRLFNWSWPDESDDRAGRGTGIARVLNVPEALGLALASRGMDESAATAVADRSLKECTKAIGEPDGIEEAAGKLLELGRKGRVGIVCDYDVDGATAQAILVETLRAVLPPGTKDPVVTVPDRNTEGFGPNARCLNFLSEQGVSCVAVLDCGTAAGKLLDRFHESFRIVPVVVDHHPPHHESPPTAGSLVNPWVTSPSDPGEHGTLCAAGLAWFLALAMLRQAGLTPTSTVQLRKRITLLAALGTSCDVMRIDVPFNRALIRSGIRILAQRTAVSPGLAAIREAAGVTGSPTSQDLGWRIGPRINAGSRMGKSDLAARCLRESRSRAAWELAKQLHELNSERVALGRKAARELDSSVGLEALADGPVNIHLVSAATPGTVGLVASSLVMRFGWPAIAVAEREDGLLAGSGRSALGFDLGSAVSEAFQEGILLSGGGHEAACGLTLKPSRLKDLRDFLRTRFGRLETATGHSPEPTHRIDTVLENGDLSHQALLAIAESQQRLEPWGQGMETPLFGVRNCTLSSSKMTPKGHLFLTLASGSAEITAVWWNAPQNWFHRVGLNGSGSQQSASDSPIHVDFAGRVELDEWNGRRRGRLVVRDLRASKG